MNIINQTHWVKATKIVWSSKKKTQTIIMIITIILLLKALDTSGNYSKLMFA